MNIQTTRSRTTALAVSAAAHAVLFGVIVFALPRTEGRSTSSTVKPAPAVKAGKSVPGAVAGSPIPSPGGISPRQLVWADAYGTHGQALPEIRPTRIWLIPAVVETTRRSIEDDILNHLWQSTLFTLLIGTLSLALRHKEARTRYWLWCVASVKFLIPILALERLGGLFPLASAASAATPTAMAMTHIAEPFTRTTVSIFTATVGGVLDWLPIALWLVWFLGAEFVVLHRLKAWHDVRAAARESRPAVLTGIAPPDGIQIRTSDTLIEPGTVGLWKPMLLVPFGIDASLNTAELKTVIDHEACHIRCHDNRTAGMQMLIEAVFWFHPLVWWIGARMVDERERACDEHVLATVDNPRTYADAILHVCQRYVYAGLATVFGGGEGDLRRRIERIMRNEIGEPVSARTRAWLAGVTVTGVLFPIGIGAITTAPRLTPQSTLSNQPSAQPRAFEVASIKPVTSEASPRGLGLVLPGDRFEATNASLRDLIAFAYGSEGSLGGPAVQPLSNEQIVGDQGWMTSDLFNVTARAGGGVTDGRPGALTKALMLRTLLTERFKLAIHHEARTATIYVLVLARRDGTLGPQLQRSNVDCQALDAARGGGPPLPPKPGTPPQCGASMRVGPVSSLMAGALSVSSLATLFSRVVNRTVIDRTGLSGAFDVDLRFDATGLPDMAPGVPDPTQPPNSDAPSFFTALQEQLGLKLNPDRGPIDVVVIDHAERPPPN